MGHMGSAHGAKAKRLCVPGMGHLWDIWDMNSMEYNGDYISPVDIGHEMCQEKF